MSNSNIGTIEEAETALLIHIYYYSDRASIPEGWTFLGSGIHRFAYSAPSGLVYKVPAIHEDNRCWEANINEAEGARILSQQESDEFGVPDTNLFEVDEVIPVVVMENCGTVEHVIGGMEKDRAKVFFRNTDCHAGNMRFYKGKVYMIDLGFFNPKGGKDCGCCECCPCNC